MIQDDAQLIVNYLNQHPELSCTAVLISWDRPSVLALTLEDQGLNVVWTMPELKAVGVNNQPNAVLRAAEDNSNLVKICLKIEAVRGIADGSLIVK